MYCWILIQIYLCCSWLLLCSRNTNTVHTHILCKKNVYSGCINHLTALKYTWGLNKMLLEAPKMQSSRCKRLRFPPILSLLEFSSDYLHPHSLTTMPSYLLFKTTTPFSFSYSMEMGLSSVGTQQACAALWGLFRLSSVWTIACLVGVTSRARGKLHAPRQVNAW